MVEKCEERFVLRMAMNWKECEKRTLVRPAPVEASSADEVTLIVLVLIRNAHGN